MTTSIESSNGAVSKVVPVELDSFNSDLLGKKPDAKHISKNRQANNSQYLSIGYIESQLDTIYKGLWSLENFKEKVILNEVIGSLELRVFHPIAGMWLTRVGCASVPIQLDQGAAITDTSKKKKNALVKNFPSLKAECVKNAAKSLGLAFGRDLNRKHNGEYSIDGFDSIMTQSDMDEIQTKLSNVDDLDELGALWDSLSKEQKASKVIRNEFTKIKTQLR